MNLRNEVKKMDADTRHTTEAPAVVPSVVRRGQPKESNAVAAVIFEP